MDNNNNNTNNAKALILVDIQYDFMEGGSLQVPNASDILEPINKLLENNNQLFDLVVLSQDWHPQNHISFASNHPGAQCFETIDIQQPPPPPPRSTTTTTTIGKKDITMKQIMWPNHCVQHSKGSEFHQHLLRSSNIKEVIIRKGMNVNVDSYSAFQDNDDQYKTELHSTLVQHHVKDIYVCGLATDYCVGYTCLDGKQLGYNVYLLSDCTRGVSDDSTNEMLSKLENNGVLLIKSTDL
ncbi:nicotinamidase [Cavenderia fasciculata]|uniref:nicotinamidase n=1 Tax=Cavenderia fasciculata TaxID=261658 RepID=F4PRD6_CACFS|nr:nicotinamidase [Cavenderia fasciculata]EGG20488.1 nicotinamidase [Cavenderia fasciculata]|eukprot:XP_004358338.1 nicotinamidase [Cavenderia fasciculata]